MNALTRWNEFRWNQLNELDHLKRCLGSFFPPARLHSPTGHQEVVQRVPPVDISKGGKQFLIKAKLPE